MAENRVNQETKGMSLIQKVAQVRNRVAVKKASIANIPTKKGDNFSYAYAKLEDIVEEINPVMDELGLFYNWYVKDNQIYVQVYNLENGECMSSAMPLDDDHQRFQEIGKQLTYFSRYLLLLILGIVAESDDDDGNSSAHASTRSSTRRGRSRVQEDESIEEEEDEYDEEEEDEPPVRSRRGRRPGRRGLPTRGER